MTLLTVDAKLMPILPLIARPESERALVVAFGMGTAFRTALIAGLEPTPSSSCPSVPEMFGYYYPDADQVLADPNGRVIVADGRNHLELVDGRFDIIVTDPPPPIQSSGVSVISSLEYYEAGRDHLTDGGVMMQWTPYGTTEADLKEHIRTFATVFPHVSPSGVSPATASTCSARCSRSPSIPPPAGRSSSDPGSSRTSRAPSIHPSRPSRTGST